MVSGLHWTMPNGTSAPGKVLPPPLVHVRVSTSVAGSLTGWLSGVVLRAPAGRFPGRTGLGQSVGLPFGPLAHGTIVPLPFASAGAAVLGLAVDGGAPGLGAGDGSAWAVAIPAMRMQLAVSATSLNLAFIDRSFPDGGGARGHDVPKARQATARQRCQRVRNYALV